MPPGHTPEHLQGMCPSREGRREGSVSMGGGDAGAGGRGSGWSLPVGRGVVPQRVGVWDAVSRRQGPRLQIICHYWQAAGGVRGMVAARGRAESPRAQMGEPRPALTGKPRGKPRPEAHSLVWHGRGLEGQVARAGRGAVGDGSLSPSPAPGTCLSPSLLARGCHPVSEVRR